MKKKVNISLCAQRLLLCTLPLVLIQMVYFSVFLLSKSKYELAGCGELILQMIEQIGKSLILSVFSALILDLLEKKERGET